MRFLMGMLLFSMVPYAAICQDMNGIWRGKLTQEPGGCYPEYYIELQIWHSEQDVAGVTYDYYDTTRFVKLNFSGRVNLLSKRMVVIENSVVNYRIPRECVPCIKTYDLTLTKVNNEDVLAGTWKGFTMGAIAGCPPGKIVLKRVNESAFQADEVWQDPKLAVIQRTLKTDNRKVELVKTLAIDTSRITLQLYDNGQIDGDTISVYVNNRLILYRGGLSTKPITLQLPVRSARDYEMIMYAENLGAIPPNTALMVVTVGIKKYEVYLSSSEIKSAAVRFRYDKK